MNDWGKFGCEHFRMSLISRNEIFQHRRLLEDFTWENNVWSHDDDGDVDEDVGDDDDDDDVDGDNGDDDDDGDVDGGNGDDDDDGDVDGDNGDDDDDGDVDDDNGDEERDLPQCRASHCRLLVQPPPVCSLSAQWRFYLSAPICNYQKYGIDDDRPPQMFFSFLSMGVRSAGRLFQMEWSLN